jgi:hypothetical protein
MLFSHKPGPSGANVEIEEGGARELVNDSLDTDRLDLRALC